MKLTATSSSPTSLYPCSTPSCSVFQHCLSTYLSVRGPVSVADFSRVAGHRYRVRGLLTYISIFQRLVSKCLCIKMMTCSSQFGANFCSLRGESSPTRIDVICAICARMWFNCTFRYCSQQLTRETYRVRIDADENLPYITYFRGYPLC